MADGGEEPTNRELLECMKAMTEKLSVMEIK